MNKYLGDKWRDMVKYLWYIIPAVQIVLAAVLCMKVIPTGILPGKYLVLGLIFFFMLLCLWFECKRRDNRVVLIIASVISVIVSCVMLYGIFAFGKVTKTLDNVIVTEPEITEVSILVKTDSAYGTIESLSGAKIGIMDSFEAKETAFLISKDVTEYPSYAVYSHFVYLVDALLRGDEDAAVIEDAFLDVLSDFEEYGSLNEQVKVIKTYEIVEEGTEPVIKILREAIEIKLEDAQIADSDGQNGVSDEDGSNQAEEDKNESTEGASSSETPKKEVVNTGGIPNASGVKTTSLDWNNDILTSGDGCFIAYMSGIDTLGSVNTKRRSDVNILAVVNTNTGTMQLISTPRDYYVVLPNAGQADKLTHAGLFGVDNSIAALERLYGIKVDYYLRMNFTGFVQIIDTLGGIDVWSNYEFTVEPVKTYTVGMNHLNGVEALAFARERYSFSSGDIQRSENQMAVIRSMVGKICSPDILYNYGAILDSISNCIQTSMPADVIYSFVNRQLSTGIAWTVNSYTTTGFNGSAPTYTSPTLYHYVMVPNDDNVAYAHELIRNTLQ